MTNYVGAPYDWALSVNADRQSIDSRYLKIPHSDMRELGSAAFSLAAFRFLIASCPVGAYFAGLDKWASLAGVSEKQLGIHISKLVACGRIENDGRVHRRTNSYRLVPRASAKKWGVLPIVFVPHLTEHTHRCLFSIVMANCMLSIGTAKASGLVDTVDDEAIKMTVNMSDSFRLTKTEFAKRTGCGERSFPVAKNRLTAMTPAMIVVDDTRIYPGGYVPEKGGWM